MTQRRLDSAGVPRSDDPTPELPLVAPGVVQPHGAVRHITWSDGWAGRITSEHLVVDDGRATGEFDTIDLSEIDHEFVAPADGSESTNGTTAPPPAPAEAFERSSSRSAESALPELSRPESTPGLAGAAPDAPDRSEAETVDEEAVTLQAEDLAEEPPPPPSLVEPPAVPAAFEPGEDAFSPFGGASAERGEAEQAVSSAGAESDNPSRAPDHVDSLMSDILSQDDGKPRRTSERWWAEVFDSTYMRLLPDSAYQRTLREADFLMGALAPPPGGRLLDVACGFGRHALELTTRGYSVVGVDLARGLLERAHGEAERRGLSIEFLLGDMRGLEFESEFHGAYCLNTSFGYYDDETNLECLARMARSLRPGARLVVGQVNRDHIVHACPRLLWWERDELVVMENITFDHDSSRLIVERSIMDETQTPWEQRISIRLYAPHEFAAMLRHVGLELLATTGDIAHPGVYVGPENRGVIMTAVKPTA